MTIGEIPESVRDDLLSRAFAALKTYRQRDEPGFWALLGDEGQNVLMVLLGLLDGWLQETAGDWWIDKQIDDFLDRRRDG
jgi:hypothetical protein